MVRRWRRSVTSVLFEEPAESLGALFRRIVQELQETLGEPVGKVLHLLEDSRKELPLVGTHGKKE